MVTLNEKTELELQEKIIDIAERIQGISKPLLWLLAATVVLALPAGFLLRYALFSVFFTPASLLIYQEPTPAEIRIVEKKVLAVGENTYFAFVRISNPNAELAVRLLPFELRLFDDAGQLAGSYEGSSYLLPEQDKLLYMPPQRFDRSPQRLELSFKTFQWSRVGRLKNLNFAFQGVTWNTGAGGQFSLSAEIKNQNPYFIRHLELGVMLYDRHNEVIGVNFTTIDDLRPEEIRHFGLVWPTGVGQAVATVDFKPAVNLLYGNAAVPVEATPNAHDYRP